MGTRGEDWEEAEMLRVLAYYASLNGGPYSEEDVQELADRMPNRGPATIKLRIANYVARDPRMKEVGRKGFSGGGNKATAFVQKYLLDDGSFDFAKLLNDCSKHL
jgi:hypothetical protein